MAKRKQTRQHNQQAWENPIFVGEFIVMPPDEPAAVCQFLVRRDKVEPLGDDRWQNFLLIAPGAYRLKRYHLAWSRTLQRLVHSSEFELMIRGKFPDLVAWLEQTCRERWPHE